MRTFGAASYHAAANRALIKAGEIRGSLHVIREAVCFLARARLRFYIALRDTDRSCSTCTEVNRVAKLPWSDSIVSIEQANVPD